MSEPTPKSANEQGPESEPPDRFVVHGEFLLAYELLTVGSIAKASRTCQIGGGVEGIYERTGREGGGEEGM